MSRVADPGWRPAFGVAARIVTFRRPRGSMLIVLRAAVVFLSLGPVVTAGLAVVLTRGGGTSHVSNTTARIVLVGAVVAALAVIVATRAEQPDLRGPGNLALWLFVSTMRRILAGAAVGPIGFLLSWMGRTGTHAIVGSVAAIVLIVASAPTARWVEEWQAKVTEARAGIDVIDALSLPYR
jgi:hypothetical protein